MAPTKQGSCKSSPRIPVATRLIILYLTLFSIPVAGAALYIGWRIDHDAGVSALSETRNLVAQSAQMVVRKMEVLESASTFLIYYKDFLSLLSLDHDPSIMELLEFKEVLANVDRIQAVNPEIARMRLFTNNTRLPEIWPYLYGQDRIYDTPWFQELQQVKRMWRLGHRDDVQVAIDRNQPQDVFISLFKLVRDDFGQVFGTLQISMQMSVFLDKFLEPVGNQDLHGIIDTHTASLVYPSNELGPSLLSLLLSRPDAPTLQGDGEVQLGGRTLIWSHIRPMGMTLVALVPETGDSMLVNARLVLMVVTLAALTLFSLVITIGTRLTLRRLNAVSQAMQELKGGRLHVVPQVGGNDEISDLALAFGEMLGRIDILINELVKEQLVSKDAELRALQGQINAHFIYNVLEALRMTAVVDYQYDLAKGLEALGKTMRYGMDWKHKQVTLADELAHVEAYLLLCNLRFDGSISLETRIDPCLLGMSMVKMSLQPLVENAVLHGFAARENQGNLLISAELEGSGFLVRVQDNGVGISNERLFALRQRLLDPEAAIASSDDGADRMGHGIGIFNVHERLRLAFGAGGLSADGMVDGLTTFTLHLPRTS